MWSLRENQLMGAECRKLLHALALMIGVLLPVPGSSVHADLLLVQFSGDGKGTVSSDTKTVSLASFANTENPLQSALDVLGSDGGTIRVPQQEWIIRSAAISAPGLRVLRIMGEGPDSALVFPNGGGGLTLSFGTPSPAEMQKDQLVVKDLAFLTTHYAAPGTRGSGVAIKAQWATAVGDTTQGTTFRDVQFMPKNKGAAKSSKFAYWDIGISLENARHNTIDNVVFAGGAVQNNGIGVELKGGTIPTLMSNVTCTDLDKCVYAHGVVEGVVLTNSIIVNCNYKLYADGDLLGSARSTSSTSNSISLGPKSFTVAHQGLAWTTPNTQLYIRNSENPGKSFMIGAITSYSGASVTVNITKVNGSGMHSSWTLSPEHKISDINVSTTHGSIVKSQVWARWTAFVFYHDNMDQKREGTSDNYADIEMLDHNSIWLIHNNVFVQRGLGGITRGIVVGDQERRGDSSNNNISISEIWFVNRDVGVLLGTHAAQVNVNDVYSIADVKKLLDNRARPENNIRTNNIIERK